MIHHRVVVSVFLSTEGSIMLSITLSDLMSEIEVSFGSTACLQDEGATEKIEKQSAGTGLMAPRCKTRTMPADAEASTALSSTSYQWRTHGSAARLGRTAAPARVPRMAPSKTSYWHASGIARIVYDVDWRFPSANKWTRGFPRQNYLLPCLLALAVYPRKNLHQASPAGATRGLQRCTRIKG